MPLKAAADEVAVKVSSRVLLDDHMAYPPTYPPPPPPGEDVVPVEPSPSPSPSPAPAPEGASVSCVSSR